MYIVGAAVVAVASALAALSLHVAWLAIARGLLGVGAAMLLATSPALIVESYPEAGRGRALGVMHMAVAGGLMAGPALGGLIVTFLGWRLLFALPIPIALVALVMAWRVLPRSHPGDREPLDLAGTALIALIAITFALGMTRLAVDGWIRSVLLLIGLAGMLSLGFVIVERRQIHPLVDLSLLRQWRFSAGLLTASLTFIALASNMFLIPFTLQDLLGYTAATSGLLMVVVPLMILPVAPLAGLLADRVSNGWPVNVGLLAIVLAIVGMAGLGETSSILTIVIVLGCYGVDAGLFQAPNNSAVLGAAPPGAAGMASGMLALSRNLGQLIGITVASAV